MLKGWLLAGIAILTFVGCNPETRRSVTVTNATEDIVVVYGGGADPGRRLRPEEKAIFSRVLREPMARVPFEIRATTMGGEPVYCRSFTWGEIQGRSWQVAIRQGEISC